jgi:hypothetical protein
MRVQCSSAKTEQECNFSLHNAFSTCAFPPFCRVASTWVVSGTECLIAYQPSDYLNGGCSQLHRCDFDEVKSADPDRLFRCVRGVKYRHTIFGTWVGPVRIP